MKKRQAFDLGENDNEAIFPMRYVDELPYIIVNKKFFKVFETDSTYVLEQIKVGETIETED